MITAVFRDFKCILCCTFFRLIGKLVPVASKLGNAAVKSAKVAAKSKLAGELKDQALSAAGNSVIDLLAGKSPAQTLQTSLEQAKETISDSIKDSLQKQKPKTLTGKKRGGPRVSKIKRKKSKNFDLFHQ